MPEESDRNAQSPSPLQRLVAALRARRTYLMIYEHYAKASPKQDFAELLQTLVDDTRDTIASLSTAMRRFDHSPLTVGVNETLLGQGMSRRGTLSKLNFILVGTGRTLDWYAEQPSTGDPPEVQALWQELIEREEGHRQMVKDFLDQAQLVRPQQGADTPAAEANGD